MHRRSFFICPLTTALLLFVMAWGCTVQAQIQGSSGICSVPINIQSLPFEASATILRSTTPVVGTSLCGFDPLEQGFAYTVTPATDKIMQAVVSWESTDSGSLGLFTGDCGTTSMACVASQSLNPIVSSPLLWEGHAGVVYTLVVAGDPFFGPLIDYSLAITEYEGPPNDECDSAVAASSLPFSAVGDNTGAFPDFDVLTCSASSTVRGVWYKFVGNGKIVQVKVTAANRFRIVLFKGSCADLFCDGNTVGSGSATHEILGDVGVEYLVLVTGYSSDSDVGTFTIDITENDLPTNYNCGLATEISSVPFDVTGDTTGAVSGHYDPSCGGDTDTRGIWYKVTGHDKIITFAVSDASFDVRTGVYTGDCDNLQLVECHTSRWGGGLAWHGLSGVQYTIVVMGYQKFSDVGSFYLDVDEPDRPSNDDCGDAEVVESLPFFGNYDTRGATVEALSRMQDPTSRGVWFKFVGGGGTIEVLLSSVTFDAGLWFYSGSCGNLVPIVIPQWSSSSTTLRVPLSTTAGEQYFVLATGDYFDDVGTFGMEITGAQVLSPDEYDPPTEPPTEESEDDPSTAPPTMQDTQPATTLPPDGDDDDDDDDADSLTNNNLRPSGAPCIRCLGGAVLVQAGSLLVLLASQT